MRDLLYNQINPIVRIEESKLLQPDQLSKMIASMNFSESKECLRNTVYDDYIDEEDFMLNFDYYLRMEQSRLFKKMYSLAPEKKVIDIYTMRYTYHNLKLLTKAHYTNQQLDRYFVEDGQYSIASLKSAIKNGTSTSVKGILMQSILDVTDYISNYDNVRGVDVIYDRYYLKNQRQAAEALNYPELTQEVIAFIDLTNISMVIRGLTQRQTTSFLLTVLSSYGSFDTRELANYATKSLDDFLSFLQESQYKELISPIVNRETRKIDLIFLSRERDNFLTRLYSVASVTAFGPLPLLSLLNAKDIEIKNIQLILAGKKNHFEDTSITERIRDNSGL